MNQHTLAGTWINKFPIFLSFFLISSLARHPVSVHRGASSYRTILIWLVCSADSAVGKVWMNTNLIHRHADTIVRFLYAKQWLWIDEMRCREKTGTAAWLFGPFRACCSFSIWSIFITAWTVCVWISTKSDSLKMRNPLYRVRIRQHLRQPHRHFAWFNAWCVAIVSIVKVMCQVDAVEIRFDLIWNDNRLVYSKRICVKHDTLDSSAFRKIH